MRLNVNPPSKEIIRTIRFTKDESEQLDEVLDQASMDFSNFVRSAINHYTRSLKRQGKLNPERKAS